MISHVEEEVLINDKLGEEIIDLSFCEWKFVNESSNVIMEDRSTPILVIKNELVKRY